MVKFSRCCRIIFIIISLFFATLTNNYPISCIKTNENILFVTNVSDIYQINLTFESCGYSLYAELYYPKNTSGFIPGIVFCEGGAGYVSAYNWIAKTIAKEGYVVLIFDYPGQGKSEGILPKMAVNFPKLNIYLRFGVLLEAKVHFICGNWVKATEDAISYLTNDSPIRDLINQSNLGLIGHSFGGKAVTGSVAQDHRIKAIVALSHASKRLVDNISIPIQFQCGDLDIRSKSIPSIINCYNKANIPKELIVISGGTHLGFTTTFNCLCPCPSWQKNICIKYAVGWFD
jgi:dienelactone hydrolase